MLSILKTSAALIVMVCLLFVAGCETAAKEMPYQTMDLAEPVTMLYKTIGGHPHLKTPGLSLINSQAELNALGVEDLLGREVNFDNEQVLLATLGELPSTGHWINITAVHQEGELLQVYGQANRPGADEVIGQIHTYPYCAAVITRTEAYIVSDQIESVEGMEPPM